MPAIPVMIRKAVKTDIPLITSTWLRHYRGAPAVQSVPNTLYFHYQHRMLERLIPQSIVLVACNEDNPDQILGWACFEIITNALVVHYVYVKGPFRGFGVGKKLFSSMKETLMLSCNLPDMPIFFFTHRTGGHNDALKALGAVYNPYLLLFPSSEMRSYAPTPRD